MPVFVGEGAPVPVAQGVITRAIIGPTHKMLVAVGIAGELEFANIESATAIIGRMLSEQAGKSLDAVLFDGNASSASRSAGLLSGVSTLGATADGGVNAMATDLGLIAKALAAAGCDPDRMVIIASPAQALVLRLTNTIIGTSALTDKTVVGVDPAAIATGYDGIPSVEVARAAGAIGRGLGSVTPAESWFRRGPDLGMVLDPRSGHLHSGRRINPLQSLIFLWGKGGIEKNFLLFHISGAGAAETC